MFEWIKDVNGYTETYRLTKSATKPKYDIIIRKSDRKSDDGSYVLRCNEINILNRKLKSKDIKVAQEEALEIITKKMNTKINDYKEFIDSYELKKKRK